VRRVLIAGGGTGGHFYPALAVTEELRRSEHDVEVGYVGTRRGIEARILLSYPWIRFFPITVRGMDRGRLLHRLGAIAMLAISFAQTVVVFARFRPDVVLGMGGHSSFPPVALGVLLGKVLPIRTIIHEQNAIAGLANRILAPHVDTVLVSYPQSSRSLAKARRIVVTGNPIRDDFLRGQRTPAVYRSFGLRPNRRTVLVFGGSNGSSRLIEEVLRAKEAIAHDDGLQILLAAGGQQDDARIRDELTSAGVRNVVVHRYIDRMGEAFAIADLIVSRAGATTLAEITSCGKPAVLVPWNGATDNHQWENARILASEGACTLADEDDIVHGGLVTLIRELVSDEGRMHCLATNSWRLGQRRAQALVLGEIRALMREARA